MIKSCFFLLKKSFSDAPKQSQKHWQWLNRMVERRQLLGICLLRSPLQLLWEAFTYGYTNMNPHLLWKQT
jgi:hypothetical protein